MTLNLSSLPRSTQVLRAVLGVAAGAAVAHADVEVRRRARRRAGRRCGSGTAGRGRGAARVSGQRERAVRPVLDDARVAVPVGVVDVEAVVLRVVRAGTRARGGPARRRRGPASGCRGTAAHGVCRSRARGSGRSARRRRALFGSLRGAVTQTGAVEPAARRGRSAAGCAPARARGAGSDHGRRARRARQRPREAAHAVASGGSFLSRTRAELVLLAGLEDREHLVAGLELGRADRDLGLAVAHDGDQARALGQRRLSTRLPATASPCRSAPRRSRGSPCAARAGGSARARAPRAR